MSNITLIIDGDVICHGACWNRWGAVKNGVPEFSNFTEQDDLKYINDIVSNLNIIIKQLQETTFANKTLIAVKGDNNFRDTVYPGYKQHRNKVSRPVSPFIDLLREVACQRHAAVRAHGMEADDLVRIWHNEALLNQETPIIASIDKDLLCIPGKHFRLPVGVLYGEASRNSDAIIEVSEIEALRNYYKQLLTGDSTDNIPGLPKIGLKRAIAILADCNTEQEMQHMVCYAYKEIIGDKWREHLTLTGKLITILPTKDFIFNIDGWMVPNEC